MTSFKQFDAVLRLPEDQLTEDKLAEIFGWSPEERKAKAATALKDLEARKQATAQRIVANRKRDKDLVQRAGGLAHFIPDPKDKGTSKRDPRNIGSASGGRAAERDWVASMAKEGQGLDEGVMHASVVGSDSAADAWYSARKKMVDAAVSHLVTELKDRGNEFNTHGPLNVAMILAEKFDDEDFEYSPRLHALGVRVLKMLEKPHGWEKLAGYKKVVTKLKELLGHERD